MASELPVQPIALSYVGLDADNHRADALYIGESLQGTARVYNSIINWHFAGRIVSPAAQSIRVHVGPAKDGSLMYAIYLLMVHGKLAMYPEIFFKLVELAIPLTLKALIARKSGQTQLLEDCVREMGEMYARHDDFARVVHADHVLEKARLMDLVERLAVANKKPLSDMAAPVGRTVRQIEHFATAKLPVVVDGPTAEALRSKEEVVVGDTQNIIGRLVAVDTVSGSGKLVIGEQEQPVRAKITDPVLTIPENVYTHALDTAAKVSVTAKPVLKGDEIATLYISDARIVKD